MSDQNTEFVKLQKQIRDNAMEVGDYVSDLNSWQADIKTKDQKLKKEKRKQAKMLEQQMHKEEAAKIAASLPADPSTIVIKPEEAKKLKRDTNNMADYYKNWDRFDPDEAIKEIDKQPQASPEPLHKDTKSAKPNSSVVIKGGRRQTPSPKEALAIPKDSPEELKTQGNTAFKSKDFNKAIAFYTDALNKNKEDSASELSPELRLILYSNRAQAYINIQRYTDAETDCNSALLINQNHPKSLHRRGVARYYLKQFYEAKCDLLRALELSPEEAGIIKVELENLEKEIDKVKIAKLEEMAELGKKGSTNKRVKVKVEEFNADENMKKADLKRQEVEAELEKKPKKGLDEFKSDDEDAD